MPIMLRPIQLNDRNIEQFIANSRSIRESAEHIRHQKECEAVYRAVIGRRAKEPNGAE